MNLLPACMYVCHICAMSVEVRESHILELELQSSAESSTAHFIFYEHMGPSFLVLTCTHTSHTLHRHIPHALHTSHMHISHTYSTIYTPHISYTTHTHLTLCYTHHAHTTYFTHTSYTELHITYILHI